jgi:rubrerythrin
MDYASLRTPADILKAALVKEQQAHDFYEQMSLDCKVDMVVELLDTLKNEESRHLRLIRAMIAKLELA